MRYDIGILSTWVPFFKEINPLWIPLDYIDGRYQIFLIEMLQL